MNYQHVVNTGEKLAGAARTLPRFKLCTAHAQKKAEREESCGLDKNENTVVSSEYEGFFAEFVKAERQRAKNGLLVLYVEMGPDTLES